MTVTPRLVATGVWRRFGGIAALAGVDAAVSAGEIVALVGPNGSGKSTLLNALTGTEHLDSGRVHLDGRDVTRAGPARLARWGVARTFQNGRILERLSALENVLVGMHAASARRGGSMRPFTPLSRRRRTALEALADVGLAAVWDQLANTLSHGQRRRVELARAFVGAPGLLLLDEPTAGLTEMDTAAVGALIERARDRGAAVLLVEHDLDMVASIAHRVLVLDEGSVVASGDPASVLSQPGVARLMGIPAGLAERLAQPA